MASSTVNSGEWIHSDQAVAQDVLATVPQIEIVVEILCSKKRSYETKMVNRVEVLTKPLGTHVACTAHVWMEQQPEKWNRKYSVETEDLIPPMEMAYSF